MTPTHQSSRGRSDGVLALDPSRPITAAVDAIPRSGQLDGLVARSIEQPLACFTDRRTGVRFEVHRPFEAPARWRAYLDGAERRYRAHGVLPALGRPGLEDGLASSLLFVAVDAEDRVMAGVRCHGPLRAASDAHALREMALHPRVGAVDALIAERLSRGLVEVKGAWVDADAPFPGLSDALARCHVHAMRWFGVQYAMCTCADNVAPRWESTGGRPMPDAEPVPYPDDRYRTLLLWWDRDRLPELASPEQWSRIITEDEDLLGSRPPAARGEPAAAGTTVDEWQAEVLD